MSVMWKIAMLLWICNQNMKWKSAFLFFIFLGCQCVNADRTGPLGPPFFTNECHVENNYVAMDMQPKYEVEKCFFVFYFVGGGGCQCVLMQTGLGHWNPPFFTNECHVENDYV